QLFVYGLFVIETMQTIMLTHDAFHELAISFGDFAGLQNLYLLWFDLPILSGILSGATQCFYAWRIYVLSRSKIIGIFIVMLSLTQCGGAFAEGVAANVDKSSSATITSQVISVSIWVGGSAACDVTITIFMVYFVGLYTKRTGVSKTDTVLNKLIRLTVETGMVTAVFAVIQLAMYVSLKQSNYYYTPSCVLSKTYTNCLMVLLNNRRTFRRSENITLQASSTIGRYTDAQNGRPIQVNIAQDTCEE
ncbi:hypothetical protein WOLCODRAFT_45078, partial [Wolfiporia cocos MD-104 SS10]